MVCDLEGEGFRVGVGLVTSESGVLGSSSTSCSSLMPFGMLALDTMPGGSACNCSRAPSFVCKTGSRASKKVMFLTPQGCFFDPPPRSWRFEPQSSFLPAPPRNKNCLFAPLAKVPSLHPRPTTTTTTATTRYCCHCCWHGLLLPGKQSAQAHTISFTARSSAAQSCDSHQSNTSRAKWDHRNMVGDFPRREHAGRGVGSRRQTCVWSNPVTPNPKP